MREEHEQPAHLRLREGTTTDAAFRVLLQRVEEQSTLVVLLPSAMIHALFPWMTPQQLVNFQGALKTRRQNQVRAWPKGYGEMARGLADRLAQKMVTEWE
jgi:hypothetical protein